MRHLGSLTIAVGAALLTSSCGGLMGPPGPPPIPVTVAPAIPAYVVGDVIGGRAARQKKTRAAGIRAVSAAEVASYVDREEVELRRQTAGTGVDVLRSGNMLLLRLPAVSTFDVGKAEIRSQAVSTMTEIALTLKTFNRSLVDVLGHTDATGSAASNKALSERRAQAIARHLSSRGVSQSRIATRGFGSAYPIGDNGTEAGRALNRRVEIKIVPIAG